MQKKTSSVSPDDRKPSLSPEAQENRMIALAVNLAEQQLRDGTASSQVISHYLKLGSTKAKLEKEILEKQKDLLTAKADSIRSNDELRGMYAEAIRAMSKYQGSNTGDIEDEDDED